MARLIDGKAIAASMREEVKKVRFLLSSSHLIHILIAILIRPHHIPSEIFIRK